MHLESLKEKILNPLERWAPLGKKSDGYGTIRIGHIFKDAPYGYMHELYKPATLDTIKAVEQELGKAFPSQFKEFLLFSNGASFYNPSGFSIYGVMQQAYLPEYKTHPWRFPTDIITSNNHKWLQFFPDSAVIIGKNDGASAYIASLGSEGPILEYDPQEPEEIPLQWSSFDEWLISEFNELFIQHDDAGNLLSLDGGVH